MSVGPQALARGLRERLKSLADCATSVWIVNAGKALCMSGIFRNDADNENNGKHEEGGEVHT